jgi:hypothetical protein
MEIVCHVIQDIKYQMENVLLLFQAKIINLQINIVLFGKDLFVNNVQKILI